MKKIILLSAILTAVSLCGAAIPDPPHVGKRAPKIFKIGKKAAVLTKNNAAVVVAPEASPVVRFAAKELSGFLSRSLKGKVRIFTAPQKGKFNIFLGFNKWSDAAGIKRAKHHRDSYTILINSKSAFIAGADDPKAVPEKMLPRGIWAHLYERATVFGVYEFLERFANCRFYFPGAGTVVPRKGALTLPESHIFDYPDFTVRRISSYSGQWPGKGAGEKMWTLKNLAAYRYRMETRHIPCCHGLARVGYLQRFGKTNPEYFALMTNGKRHNNPSLPHPGSLCYSSGIREEIYQDVKSYLTGKPAAGRNVLRGGRAPGWDPNVFQPGFADIMPQDSYYRCRCEKCKPRFTDTPNYASDFMWGLTAEVAARLQKEKIPGHVTMMVYFPYRDVPRFKLPSNILVMVAATGAWARYNTAGQKKSNAEVAAWAKKINKKVWLWNYIIKKRGAGFDGIPTPTAHCVAPYYKEIAPYITGAFQQGGTDRWINNYLFHYLFGKFAWNNRSDLEAMIREHHTLMFGKAAGEMGKLFSSFEKTWLKDIVGRQIDTPLGPTVIPPSEHDLWHKIYNASRIARVQAAFDRAEKLVKNDRESLARVKLFRSEWLDPLRKARERYLERTDAVGKFAMSESSPAHLRVFQGRQKITQKPVKTVVRFKEDKNFFHFTFDCEEPLYEHAVAARRERDNTSVWQDSGVELFINPAGDRKVYYQFILNLKNSLFDQKLTMHGARSTGDAKWNSGAVTSVKRTAKGYEARIAIPKKAFPGCQKEGFPVNFGRNRVLSKGVGHALLYTWSPFVKGFHDLENYGTLKRGKEAPKAPGVIMNGDFSAPPRGRYMGGWYGAHKYPAGKSCTLDHEVFFTAPPSLRFDVAKGIRGGLSVTQFMPKLKPSTRYRLSAYVRFKDVRPMGKSGGVAFNFYDTGNRWAPRNFPMGTSRNWVRQSYEFVTPADTGRKLNDKGRKIRPYFRLYLYNATGTVWFDDVTIDEVK